MSTQPYGNDDDLFSYDPTQDQVQKEQYTSSESFTSTNSNNQLLDDVYRSIENVSSRSEEDHIRTRVGLANSLYDAYSSYVEKSSSVAYVQAVSSTLDEITNGKFSATLAYYQIEQNIFRRIQVHFLLQAVIENNDSDEVSFQEFLKRLNIIVPEDFTDIYFSTIFRISNHVLNIERAHYIALAKKLGLTPISAALDPTATLHDVANAVPESVASFKDLSFIKSLYSNADEEFLTTLKTIVATDSEPKIVEL